MKKLFQKLFKTDSEWPMVITALVFSGALLSSVFIFYGAELVHTAKLGIVLFALIVLLPATVYFGYKTVKGIDDPNQDKNRWFTILCAVAFSLATCIPSAQYRADKSDNIQFDKQLSK